MSEPMTRASDAAIERACEGMSVSPFKEGYWIAADYGSDPQFTVYTDHLQTLSDALRAHFGDDVPDSLAGFVLPVVVDPIVEMVREAFAQRALDNDYHPDARRYRDGSYDHNDDVVFTLSVARAIAAQGGERG